MRKKIDGDSLAALGNSFVQSLHFVLSNRSGILIQDTASQAAVTKMRLRSHMDGGGIVLMRVWEELKRVERCLRKLCD